MAELGLTWWHAPAWLDGEDTVFDAAQAEPYPTRALGPDVLFDFVAVTTAREAVDFVTRYGFLQVPPGQPPYERTSEQLLWADQFRMLLRFFHLVQHVPSAEIRAQNLAENPDEALANTFAERLAPVPAGTLLD